MGILEQEAYSFWESMQKLKHGESVLSKSFAREIELPQLALRTNSERLQQRIEQELSL
jgi:hypothetical protein